MKAGEYIKLRWKAMTGRLEAWGRLACDESGQGTTEYAILVGVLVVMAVIAVSAFSGKLQALWDGISQSINAL